MKAILMSIKPKWVAKILNGEKTIEIRKKFPSDYRGWVYIYATKAGLLWKEDKWFGCDVRGYSPKYSLVGKVVARFWCDKVEDYVYGHKWSWKNGAPMWGADNGYEKILKDACLTDEELRAYVDDLSFSAIHISKLEIFDKPRELSEFNKVGKKCSHNKSIEEKEWWCEWCSKPECIGDKLTKAPQSWQYVEV